MQNGRPTDPVSAVEFAVDLHATQVIAANNYQRCINALWRGYYNVQYYEDDRLTFGEYEYLTSQNFRDHFDTQRIKGSFPQGAQVNNSAEVSEFITLILYDIIFGIVHDCCEYTQYNGKLRPCGRVSFCFCIWVFL